MGSLDFFSSLLAVLGILLLDAALLTDHNYSEAAARILRVSNFGGVSGVYISEMTDGDDDDTCIAPTSTSLVLGKSVINW
jgi:hypothetical protein